MLTERTRAHSGWLVLMLAAVLTATPLALTSLDAQVQGRKSNTKAAARRDSIAAAGVDSARRAQLEADRLDSLGKLEAARLQAIEDSLRTVQLRRIDNKAFGTGERLVFDISYGLITAGEAILAIPAVDTIHGRAAYRVQVNVNSLPSFSWIYRVEDVYRTFIDVDALTTHRFEQHIREGSYSRDFVATFDQIRNIAHVGDLTYPIPPYVHDIMSAFYYTRTIDFGGWKTGDTFTVQNFYKDKTYDLTVKFLGRQEQEVGAGTFRTIVVEPLVREGGLFKSEGRIVVWLSDDDLKLPIRVNATIVLGSIDVELREYSGIIGKLHSRIE